MIVQTRGKEHFKHERENNRKKDKKQLFLLFITIVSINQFMG